MATKKDRRRAATNVRSLLSCYMSWLTPGMEQWATELGLNQAGHRRDVLRRAHSELLTLMKLEGLDNEIAHGMPDL